MNSKNNWSEIWNKRKLDTADWKNLTFEELYLILSKLNGRDAKNFRVLFSSEFRQYEEIKKNLNNQAFLSGCSSPLSIFEAGCGSGARLLLFQRDGFLVGGMDYSKPLTEVANMVLEHPLELLLEEAVNIPIQIQYDYVISCGVFSYFPDFNYAEQVLNRMLLKCKRSIGVTGIHHDKMRQNFLQFHRSIDPNYDQHYQGLDKLFYSKAFFIEFAERHSLDIKITPYFVDGYWNNEFLFNCYLYKRE